MPPFKMLFGKFRYPTPSLTGRPHPPDAREIKAELSDHPGQSVTLRAERLCLLAPSHDREHITWTSLGEVRLGTAR